MLIKVDKVGHIGRFELPHRAEPMKRLARLFARNGTEKSTMCALLRSVIAQDAKPIDERIHRGNAGAPLASLKVDGVGTVAFNSGAWNRAAHPMRVFDQEFVCQKVHAAKKVMRGNKRGLFKVVIGSTGGTLGREIEALDEENLKINATREQEAAIMAAVPGVTDIAAIEMAGGSEPLSSTIRLCEASR